jgi:metal-responsive CopG/Arc/MetJ family transcriptional regulator
MNKKFGKKIIVAMPEDLFDKFQEVCEEQYTTMSQEIRTFMLQYIKEHKNGKKTDN